MKNNTINNDKDHFQIRENTKHDMDVVKRVEKSLDRKLTSEEILCIIIPDSHKTLLVALYLLNNYI